MYNFISEQIYKIGKSLDNRIDRYLDGTHHHYASVLPRQKGKFFSRIFRFLFQDIQIGEEQTKYLKELPDNNICIYVSKYKSYLELYFSNYRYRKDGICFPRFGFDCNAITVQPISRMLKIFVAHLDYFRRYFKFPNPYTGNYYKQELIKGNSAILFLVEKKGFYRRFVKATPDPLNYLIRVQKSISRPIFLIPQLVFYHKNPNRTTPSLFDMLLGTDEKPGKIRRLTTLVKNSRKVFVEFSEPINLKQFLQESEIRDYSIDKQSWILRQRLINQLNRHRQSITGPILKSREELKESILTTESLRSFMQQHSHMRKIPMHKVNKKANAYINEIAARYNPSFIKVLSFAVRSLLNLMFEGVSVNNEMLTQIKSYSRQGPIIFIPCHKSHIDYLILSYMLYQNNMPCPHIAAGKNLSFWPLGPLFRRGGAFFIRRTFRGAILYSKVFSEYIHKLLSEGFNIEFFIEGGRSRTGKLLQPKLGFLSILLNAYKNKATEELFFVPIFIGYDRVLEESSYLYELEGGQKKPEDISQVFKARKFLKKRYGRIYIKFHEPYSINNLLEQKGLDIDVMSAKDLNQMCRELGYRVLNAIDRITVATPHAVVASALLNCTKVGFTYDHILKHVETYMNYLFYRDADLADTLLVDHVHAIQTAFSSYVQRKFIERISDEKEAEAADLKYFVASNKRPLLEYYKNTNIALFINAAFTAMSILEKDAFQFSSLQIVDGFSFLQDFFQYEFASDVEKTAEDHVRFNLHAFTSDAILMPHPTMDDTYNMTSAGFRKLNLFARFLIPFFESYWIVLKFLSQSTNDTLEPKERTKKIQNLGNRLYKNKEVYRRESLSGLNYQNALDFFSSKGIKDSGQEEKIEQYDTYIKRYIERIN